MEKYKVHCANCGSTGVATTKEIRSACPKCGGKIVWSNDPALDFWQWRRFATTSMMTPQLRQLRRN